MKRTCVAGGGGGPFSGIGLSAELLRRCARGCGEADVPARAGGDAARSRGAAGGDDEPTAMKNTIEPG